MALPVRVVLLPRRLTGHDERWRATAGDDERCRGARAGRGRERTGAERASERERGREDGAAAAAAPTHLFTGGGGGHPRDGQTRTVVPNRTAARRRVDVLLLLMMMCVEIGVKRLSR